MLSEARDAVRSLVRDRGATLLSVSLLALTIGATTAVYAVVHAVVLRPLAFAAPDRTVVIWQRDPARETPVVEVALGEVDAWRRHTRAFDALAVFGSVNWSITVLDGDARTRIPSASVSASFFDVAGTPPALGRVFNAHDDGASEPRAVIISHALWVQDFGRTPDVIGRVIRVQTDVESPVRAVEIIGVTPPAFDAKERALNAEEWQAVLRSATRPQYTFAEHRDRLALLLAYATGLRRAELACSLLLHAPEVFV